MSATDDLFNDKWLEGLTKEEALYHIRRASRMKGRKHWSLLAGISAYGFFNPSAWITVSKDAILEYINKIADQRSQFKNGVSTVTWRIQVSTGYGVRVSVWAEDHFEKDEEDEEE